VIAVVATKVEAPAGAPAAAPRKAFRRGQPAKDNDNPAFHISLLINGKTVATGEFTDVPFGGAGALSIGNNAGTPVSRDYASPNPFTGVINGVTFHVTPPVAQASTSTNLTGPWRSGDALDAEDAPRVANHALLVSAEIEVAGTNGVIISQGADINGYALYLKDRKPAFAIRSQRELTTVTASEPLGKGHFVIEAKLAADGTISIIVDGKQVASGHAPGLIANQPARGLTIGLSNQSVGDYDAPDAFSGKIENVKVQTL